VENNQALVQAYFEACSRGDVDAIAAAFCEDATVYDTNHRPIRGAADIGRFYAKVRERWCGATWHIDTFVGSERGAASEWTMLVRHEGRAKAVRGSEHYEFRGGRISEIRQYWIYDPDTVGVGLQDYPYATDARFAMPAAE
jgi:ketosteroid isomerase-like protein